MAKQASVFRVKNLMSGKAYVVVGDFGLEFYTDMTFAKLRCNMFLSNTPLQADFRFYGQDCFAINVLYTGPRKQALLEKKSYLIDNWTYNNNHERLIDKQLRIEHALTMSQLYRRRLLTYRANLPEITDADAKEEIESEIKELVSDIETYQGVINNKGRLA